MITIAEFRRKARLVAILVAATAAVATFGGTVSPPKGMVQLACAGASCKKTCTTMTCVSAAAGAFGALIGAKKSHK